MDKDDLKTLGAFLMVLGGFFLWLALLVGLGSLMGPVRGSTTFAGLNLAVGGCILLWTSRGK